MSELHIVTVATESKYYFPYLIESCKRHGKELEILGYGEKWKGFNWRFKLMIEYLKKLPQNDIVCFVDGYDVLCVRDLDEMKKLFLEIRNKTGCEMIIGINEFDKNNYIYNIVAYTYFGKCNDSYINAGAYIGYANDLLKIINEIIQINNKDDADDQVLITEYCNKSNTNIYIDNNGILFVTLFHPLCEIDEYFEISEDTKVVSYKLNRPFFIHANTYGYLDGIIKKLGYSMESNKIKNELFYNFLEKKIFLYVFMILKNNVILIIFLIILLLLFFYISKNYKKNNKKIKYRKK
jgi:hypothetical protein